MKIACLYPLNVMYVFFFFKVYPFYIIKKMVAMWWNETKTGRCAARRDGHFTRGWSFLFCYKSTPPSIARSGQSTRKFFPFFIFWWNKKNGFSVPHYKIDIFLNSHGAHTGRVHNMMNGNQNWPKRNRTTSMTMCSVTRSFGSLSLYRTFYATKFTKDWETGSHFEREPVYLVWLYYIKDLLEEEKSTEKPLCHLLLTCSIRNI